MNKARTMGGKIIPRILYAGSAPAIEGAVKYSIATLVNDPKQYEAMRASFQSGGFSEGDCEYLFIDNTSPPQICAYSGLNALLNAARGSHVILCHQDVRLLTDTRTSLDRRLEELDRADPAWALAGNAGGVRPGKFAIRITDPHGTDQNIGPFPARVQSLDENFIVVRRGARIGFSQDLSGFHFYGADICLHADMAGHSAYVIDFHLAHLSAGHKSKAFHAMEAAFRKRWEQKLKGRRIQTTCSLLHLYSGPLTQVAGRIAEAPLARITRRFANAKSVKATGRNSAG